LSSVLVVVAHPDDAILGCGASIAVHSKAGDAVHLVAMADGIMGRAGPEKPERAAEFADHQRAAEEASRILGVASFTQGDFPDQRLDTIPQRDLTHMIEEAIARHRPEVVYTHYPGDLNADHVRVAECVAVACRPRPGGTMRRLLFFEVPSSTEARPPSGVGSFAPTWFVDVTRTIEQKRRALQAYAMEMRPFPHPRSIEAVMDLAAWRGASVGVPAAEAFVLARNLER
jgi:N-acetylglucosamine malate deacetylase 1